MAQLHPRKTLLVFCEGARTEPEYLDALRRLPEVRNAAAVDIRIDRNSAGFKPLGLVRAAIAAREKAIREEGEVDEFWCLFDVEWPHTHPGLREAVALAADHGICLAISNPCFELWLALHFADQAAWLDNDGARRLRRRHDGQADKGLAADIYMPNRAAAATRAAKLERSRARNGTRLPDNNPSSGMHLLIGSVGPVE
ncbi:RloB family protein [Actinoplanes sp. NPDC051343]|uniref:RloB family protein n=1 Tax=Actinoplanes sp. NPDC051343 TaxID=3363906 RepID=UPI0037912EA3